MKESPRTAEQLAYFGGPRAVTESLPDWPLPDEAVREALLAAYADGSWGRYHGPATQRLGEKLAKLCQSEHVLLCSSGTIGVELALRAVKVAPGDEVILSAYDFPGNFRAIEAIGARPVLVDLDPRNWNMSVDALAEALGPTTRAVLVSHLHGGIVPMPRVMELARAHGAAVVEDACQAVGSTVAGQPAGSWGDAGVLSFGGSKLLTAGRGGAVVTSRADVHQRAKIYNDRGNQAFPLSELQAAVLAPQIDRLPQRHAVRRGAVERLCAADFDRAVLRPFSVTSAGDDAAFYKLGFQYTAAAAAGLSRGQLSALMRAEGVPLDPGFRAFLMRVGRRCRSVGGMTESRRAAQGAMVLHHSVLYSSPCCLDEVAFGLFKVAKAIAQHSVAPNLVFDAPDLG